MLVDKSDLKNFPRSELKVTHDPNKTYGWKILEYQGVGIVNTLYNKWYYRLWRYLKRCFK